MMIAACEQNPRLPNPLPPIREELKIFPAPSNADGSPAWTIQDPVINSFFHIGWLEFELLSRWNLGDPEKILAVTDRETILAPSMDELSGIYTFLIENQLLSVHHHRYTQYLLARMRGSRLSRARWLLRNYLFFRVPLIRPAAVLIKLLPRLEWLFSRSALMVLIGLSLLGLGLTARQWDQFNASFSASFSSAGIFGYMLAVAVCKSVHELGHALTATRYGLRVSHMGVAFLVMCPVLYTDTSEAWRLPDRRQRLNIVSAGILGELALAGLATLGWNLTQNGDLKQILFFVATTAWMLSLFLNISPFMRFDGYFLLSDALDMPNLHERASALARVALRRVIFDSDDTFPEEFPCGRRRAIIAFAFVTWVYRLTVFVGIAIAVYAYFFKLLGIILFSVEIIWFVARPILSELKVWRERRAQIPVKRRLLGWCGVIILFLAVLIPWRHNVGAPGWAHPIQSFVFYSPNAAQLLTAPPSTGRVDKGDVLFTLEQPDLMYRSDLANRAAETLRGRLRTLMGVPEGEEDREVLSRQLDMYDTEVKGRLQETARLSLGAPFDGIVTDVDPQLSAGTWVGPNQPLAVLINPAHWLVETFLPPSDIKRIETGAQVRFYPRAAPLNVYTGKVEMIDTTRTHRLPHPMLSASYGGQITVASDSSNLIPRDALYRVRIKLDIPVQDNRMLSGTAVIDGKPESWLWEALKPVAILIIRELTF